MKIVQINATCGIGSTGRTTVELAEYLEQKGHQAHVFYATGTSSFANSTPIGSMVGQKIHALLSRVSGKQAYFSRPSTRKMLRQMDELKPDVVHLRNLHGNYIHLGMLLRYLATRDIPTVITLHDCWFMTGKCTHYVSAGCEKWKTRCGNCPLLHIDNGNPTWFFDRTARCFLDKKRWFGAIPRLAVVGVSQWVREEAAQSIFQSRNPITIYNWIDTGIFYPRSTEVIREKYRLGDSFVVLMVTSQVCDSKGYRILLGLAERLDDNFKLVLVGKNNLRLPIPSRVLHLPHTDDAEELAALYSAADVCVNTTQSETFGKVTAEALCCGTPVVVYRNTASPELVGPGCGYVVEESERLEAVLQAVRKIKTDGKSAYTEACVAFATERFSQEKGMGQYLALYRELAAMPSHPKGAG